MKYTHCKDCGKEKTTFSAQKSALCNSCGKKGRVLSNEAIQKIKESLKGRTGVNTGRKFGVRSIESRIAISIGQGGDGDIENRRFPGLRSWTRLVKERDGCCFICQTTEKLEAHHILPKSKYPEFATELWNGIVMCKTHHSEKHRNYK